MKGPITYDLVSLLKDCYITWPQEKIHHWVKNFYTIRNLHSTVDFSTFLQWFDAVGLQRHLKVLGVFSRLKLRDNKPHYLKELPRIMNYVLGVTNCLPLAEFDQWLQLNVMPLLQERVA
jgi:aminoglycoside/choline kinase family phosphotransferase